MSRNFSLTEPHPSVPKTGAFITTGRGGAGNYQRYKAEELTSGPTATGPASRVALNKTAPRPVMVGRGGAGNQYRSSAKEETMFQFDEEMIARRDAQAPVYHIGRGGAANFVDESRVSRRNGSASSASSTSSNSSADSVRRSVESTLGKIQRKLTGQ